MDPKGSDAGVYRSFNGMRYTIPMESPVNFFQEESMSMTHYAYDACVVSDSNILFYS